MKKHIAIASGLTVLLVSSLSAHIMVSPPESKTGATQKYEVRVHNEGKVAAKQIDLEVPNGVAIVEVAKVAATTFETKKDGDRVTSISWKVDVAPSKYLALPFTAKNPASGGELQWNVTEHLADGSTVQWSNKPGAQEKGSVTKLTAPPPSR